MRGYGALRPSLAPQGVAAEHRITYCSVLDVTVPVGLCQTTTSVTHEDGDAAGQTSGLRITSEGSSRSACAYSGCQG